MAPWRQAVSEEERGALLLTPKRRDQKEQNPARWDALLPRTRRVIETVFAQGKASFGWAKPYAQTLWSQLGGLLAKFTGLTNAAWFS